MKCSLKILQSCFPAIKKIVFDKDVISIFYRVYQLICLLKSHAVWLARICMGDDQLAGLCMVPAWCFWTAWWWCMVLWGEPVWVVFFCTCFVMHYYVINFVKGLIPCERSTLWVSFFSQICYHDKDMPDWYVLI